MLNEKEKDLIWKEINSDVETFEYLEKMSTSIVGHLDSPSFHTITTMPVKTLKEIIKGSFLEGVFYKELQYRSSLEDIFKKD